jgi:hypothetical protein
LPEVCVDAGCGVNLSPQGINGRFPEPLELNREDGWETIGTYP